MACRVAAGSRTPVTLACLSCQPNLPALLLTAALDAYNYTSKASGITYVFNNTPVNSYDAQTTCNTYGGHLVWFSSLHEQLEVERGLIAMGKLFPTFHTSYWIGYRAAKASTNPADFIILDKTAGAQTYAHWGTFKPAPAGKDPAEPNNLQGGENCAVGNFTEIYANASGWADASCGLRLPFVCKLLGERIALARFVRAVDTAMCCSAHSPPPTLQRPVPPAYLKSPATSPETCSSSTRAW
jgi:hypothetical protein